MDRRYRDRADPFMQMNPEFQRYGGGGGYMPSEMPPRNDGSPTPPAMSSLLDKVPLGSDEENSRLLDLVDRLRECRVDQFIDLPQVVAVGDQSSGKSSVLEAITQLPFPRDSIQCTRYATQIRLRRDNSLPETRTKISILAHNKGRDQARFDSFERTVDEGFDFADVFRQATDLIFQTDSTNFLSRDILSIERTGPNLPHLTIVDLPGIIHNPTKTQTAADVDAIAELSRTYMSKERTIILPIVGCDAEYAKQVIVRRCKEADPAGIRTLGVITKPDMTLTPQREDMFVDLAANKDERNKLLLGWHVLRNRAHDEMHFTTEERDAEEKKYFQSSKWGAKLDQGQLGVEALRKKLSTQLIRHIANEVFKVQDDIERQLDQCKRKLKELGPGCDTIEQMRQELQLLCKRAASLTQAAVLGQGINPLGEDFFPRFNEGTKRYARNLRSRVVIQNEFFSDSLEKWGSSCIIDGAPGDTPAARRPDSSRTMIPVVSRKDFIDKEVRPLIQDNPGQEISVDINPLLVYRLFQQYSRRWPDLADQHITAVQRLCEEFLTEVMMHAWPKRVQNRVWRGFVEPALEQRWAIAESELEKLKKDRFRYIRTYHSSFDERYYRFRETPKENGAPPNPLNKYDDTLNKMILHYEHQLPTFINNVITQVVERHLIDDMEEIFERERVLALKDIEIKQLMEEDYLMQSERKELRDQRDILQNGLNICREIACRPDLGPYEYQEPKLYNPTPISALSSATGLPSLPSPASRRQLNSPPQHPPRPAPAGSAAQPNTPPRPTGARSSTSAMPSRPAPPVLDDKDAMAGRARNPQQTHFEAPASAEDEDEAFQKAIRMSLAESEGGGAKGKGVWKMGDNRVPM